jgi:Xaa-Pro dipeptidase
VLLERNGYPCFSDAEFANRHTTTREMMRSLGLDALLLFGNRASHNEVQYLTNLTVAFEAMLLFPAEGEAVLWVNYVNHQATARAVSIVEDVRWGGDDLAATASSALSAHGLASKRIGVAGPVSHSRWSEIQRGCPHAELVDAQPLLACRRLIKSEEEIEWARRGAQLTDLAIDALCKEIRPGLSEHDLAAVVQSAYYALGGRTHIHYIGSTAMNAPGIFAPSQIQSSRQLAAGDLILTELSAAYHGYWGQVLRCFTVASKPTPELARMHEFATELFNRICETLRDGIASDEVLDVADSVHRAGYNIYDDLVHMANGGVYAPYLRTRATTHGDPPSFTYREDMLVVVQPNIVNEELTMGVQVGEMVLITKQGVERLHRAPLELISCG